eukprot:COSAG05_NODE_220_length_13701_cov_24.582855_7_plen_102_part_00
MLRNARVKQSYEQGQMQRRRLFRRWRGSESRYRTSTSLHAGPQCGALTDVVDGMRTHFLQDNGERDRELQELRMRADLVVFLHSHLVPDCAVYDATTSRGS